MSLYDELKNQSIVNMKVCHSYLKGKCKLNICRYTHPNFREILMIDNENVNETPCSFILEKNGCAMNIPRNGKLKSCELDNRRNHFFKPKYICEQYFYDTSNNYNIPNCGHPCDRLHISWKNFERNMFHSTVDSKKHKCIDFLVNIIFNLVCRDMQGEEYEFNQILIAHNKLMKVYKEQYLSKCIKCGLSPYRFKLQNPQCFSVFALHKYNLCIDLSKIVSEYMYVKHKKLNNTCYDCLFIRSENIYGTNPLACITFMGLSKLSLYGERAVSLYPPYSIVLIEDNKGRYVESKNGPDIDVYDSTIKNKIWKMLMTNIPANISTV